MAKPRFNMFRDMRVEQPELDVGGTTVHWVKADGQKEICKVRSPKFCGIHIVKDSKHEILMERDSKHEILMERDSIRDGVLAMIRQFIAAVD